jgi:hypothetical protein
MGSSGGEEALVAWGSTSRAWGPMLPFAERTGFTGVYRNEASSEMCFLSAGIFGVQVSRCFVVVTVMETVSAYFRLET